MSPQRVNILDKRIKNSPSSFRVTNSTGNVDFKSRILIGTIYGDGASSFHLFDQGTWLSAALLQKDSLQKGFENK